MHKRRPTQLSQPSMSAVIDAAVDWRLVMASSVVVANIRVDLTSVCAFASAVSMASVACTIAAIYQFQRSLRRALVLVARQVPSKPAELSICDDCAAQSNLGIRTRMDSCEHNS